MTEVRRVGDLELAQDLDYQRRLGTAQRAGWVAMLLLALAALLGLLGSGPLSSATAGDEGGALAIGYNRFGRYQAPTTLRVRLGPGAGREGEARVWLSESYLQNVQIQQITPQPQRVEVGPDGQTYVFQLAGPNQPAEVTFYLQPDRFGPLSGQVRLAGEQPVRFRQFVYP